MKSPVRFVLCSTYDINRSLKKPIAIHRPFRDLNGEIAFNVHTVDIPEGRFEKAGVLTPRRAFADAVLPS